MITLTLIVDFTEKLNPKFINRTILQERYPPRYLAGPGWGLIRNDQINITIEKEFEKGIAGRESILCQITTKISLSNEIKSRKMRLFCGR